MWLKTASIVGVWAIGSCAILLVFVAPASLEAVDPAAAARPPERPKTMINGCELTLASPSVETLAVGGMLKVDVGPVPPLELTVRNPGDKSAEVPWKLELRLIPIGRLMSRTPLPDPVKPDWQLADSLSLAPGETRRIPIAVPVNLAPGTTADFDFVLANRRDRALSMYVQGPPAIAAPPAPLPAAPAPTASVQQIAPAPSVKR